LKYIFIIDKINNKTDLETQMRKTLAIITPIILLLSCGGERKDPVETAKTIEDPLQQAVFLENKLEKKLPAGQYETLSYMLAKNYKEREEWNKLSDLSAVVAKRSDAGAQALNFIAWNLLEKEMNADIALSAAEKAVALMRNPNLELITEDLSEAAFQQRMKWKLSSYLDTYSWALLQNEKIIEAEKALEEAETLDEENTEVLIHLAKIKMRLQKPDQAYNLLIKAIVYGGGDEAQNLAQEAYSAFNPNPKDFEKSLQKAVDDLKAVQLSEMVSRQLDMKAPDFKLTDLNGDTVTLADYRGKIVFLDFWATWCPPCRQELPVFQAAFERYKDEGIAFIAVSTDKEKDKAAPFIKENGYTFTVLFDDGAKKAYDVAGIPTLFIIDTAGVIRYKHIGFRPDAGEIWVKQIDRLRE